MKLKARDFKVGHKIKIRGQVHTIKTINEYGTSCHSIIISTDLSYGEGLVIDKMEEWEIIE